jgi:hypothetical protein
MYLVLLMFGLVLAVAGTGLAASGISVHDRIFDMTAVTPGIVAATGGLLLIGLGLALRVLQRIEQALATRPPPRVARSSETFERSLASERPNEARMPSRQKANTRPQIAAAAADARQMEDLSEKHPAKWPETSPAPARWESADAVEEMDPPSSSRAASSGIARRGNGAVPAPQVDMSARSPPARERLKSPAFDALWPKGQRPARSAQSVPTPAVTTSAPEALAVESEQNNEWVSETSDAVAAGEAAVSVLKSGVVDGMAYTLFSDGSIEAELPQGTLRFGSITELRDHIEQSA